MKRARKSDLATPRCRRRRSARSRPFERRCSARSRAPRRPRASPFASTSAWTTSKLSCSAPLAQAPACAARSDVGVRGIAPRRVTYVRAPSIAASASAAETAIPTARTRGTRTSPMTSHVGRLYAASVSILLPTWLAVAAHPWAPQASDPQLAARSRLESSGSRVQSAVRPDARPGPLVDVSKSISPRMQSQAGTQLAAAPPVRVVTFAAR